VPTNKGHQALNDYTSVIQRIVSCITEAVCYCYPNAQRRQSLAWASKGYLKLTCEDGSHLYVDINQEVDDPVPENRDRVSTKYYLYSIADSEMSDLVGFHYHPELNEDPVLYPHVHAYANKDDRYLSLGLHRRHIPSGRVALEDVVHWLIDELKVKPLRDDWESVLSEAKAHFKHNQTWY
jgi:hypothetical protein